MLTLSIGIILICAALCGLLIVYDYIRNRLGLSSSCQQSSTVPFLPAVCDDDYVPFLRKVLMPCVKARHEECSLAAPEPEDIASHIVLSPDCSMVHPKYGIVYCYDFKRHSRVEGGLDNFRTTYSTLPLGDIVKKINGSLPKYAIAAGYRPCVIVDAEDLEDGTIRFTVGVTP